MTEPVDPIVDQPQPQPATIGFSVGVDLELNVIVLKLTESCDTVALDAQGARALVELVMRAGKRLAEHNSPRIVLPDARSYVRRVLPDSVNGALHK